MTMVVENLNDMTVARSEHAVYVKDSNVLLKLYGDSVSIIDLDALPLPMPTTVIVV